MKTIIDPLRLRQIRLEYSSPAICEVDVSLSGSTLTVTIEGDV